MATTFLLIRHAAHDWLGRGLAGRIEGVTLNAQGSREANLLAACLSTQPVHAIFVSPRERARETARPLAQRLALEPVIEARLDEIDFGDWSGRSFDALSDDSEWQTWCTKRSHARPPRGETIGDAQTRAIACLRELARTRADSTLALVTHGDIIKATLAHYLGMSLDHLESFDIAPASVSVVVTGEDWAQVKLVNAPATAFPTSASR